MAFFLQNYFEKNVEKYQLLFLLKSHRSKRDRSETYNLNLKTVSTFFYLITCIESTIALVRLYSYSSNDIFVLDPFQSSLISMLALSMFTPPF